MSTVQLNRAQLKRVLAAKLVTKKQLAQKCEISRPALDAFIHGNEPKHAAVTRYINEVIAHYVRYLPERTTSRRI